MTTIPISESDQALACEAVILTGGASQRMGADKAEVLVAGVPQAERIVHSLTANDFRVTVLGRFAIPGAAFLEDDEQFGGPLAALAPFRPKAPYVFVCSCDMPLFDAGVVALLCASLQSSSGYDAAVPIIDGFRQPLCAVYRRGAFGTIQTLIDGGERSMRAWLGGLNVLECGQDVFRSAGFDPTTIKSANSPSELRSLLEERQKRPG